MRSRNLTRRLSAVSNWLSAALLIWSLTLAAVLALLPAVVRGDITTGLQAHLKLDEGSGTSAADATSNGHTGAATGSPSWVIGKLYNALNWDGVNDYLVIAPHAGLRPANTTIAFWLKLTALTTTTAEGGATTSEMYVVSLPATVASTNDFYLGNDNKLYWIVAGAGNVATGALSAGDWYHIAVTFDGTSKKMYVNGSLANTTANATAISYYSLADVRIGRRSTDIAYNAYLNGVIDDFRLYSRALTAADVAELYNQPTVATIQQQRQRGQ